MTLFFSIRIGGLAAGVQTAPPYIGIDEAPDDGANVICVMAGVTDEEEQASA